jgi:3-oxoacyl-[acyl-carrier-protein] synthase-3
MASRPSRVSQRSLNSNGIQQRYYAIHKQQQRLYSKFAVRAAISQSNREPGAIDLLACATTLPDLLVSGFVSTVQGELSELSPLEIVSTQGVCCGRVSALNYAPSQLEPYQKQTAIAVAAEFPSRLFKNTQFEA